LPDSAALEIAISTMRSKDWEPLRAICLYGIATGNSPFEQSAPDW